MCPRWARRSRTATAPPKSATRSSAPARAATASSSATAASKTKSPAADAFRDWLNTRDRLKPVPMNKPFQLSAGRGSVPTCPQASASDLDQQFALGEIEEALLVAA